ncbi:MAG TPA: hypothetical protein VHA14_01835 [Bryobacteraceae bacterium]|nr:hypothetical protein [Bryobacteraceae bacterium]
MDLDIRLLLGGLFGGLGVLLMLYGWLGDASVYSRSLDVNVNLIWGSVLLLFGIVMAAAALMGARQKDRR